MAPISGVGGSTGSSTNVGSGLLSSTGIGSGLPVDKIIEALVGAKSAGPTQQISSQATKLQSQAAGLTALGSALSSLQGALSKLGSSLTFNSFGAKLGDATLGSLSTLPNARPGSYNLVVDNLATAQKRASGAYAAGTTPGAGNLTVSVGGKSMEIAVEAGDSLTAIASAINNGKDNPGVQATVVNGKDGAQLLLTSSKTGVANGFSVSADAGSSAGLGALATTLNTAGANEAVDAKLSIDGIAVSSASNAVSGVLDGVTINLAKTGSTTLTVTRDNSVAAGAVNDFVNAYNSYVTTVNTLSSYDKNSGQAGVLFGDATLTSVQRQINSVLSGGVAGNGIGSLAALGIVRTASMGGDPSADGTLKLDTAALNKALDADPAAVQDLFGGSNGYSTRLKGMLDGFTSGTGTIATRNASIQEQLTSLSKDKAQLDARMNVYATQLRQQYTALDTLMSKMANITNYLSSSLKALENMYNGGNK